MSYSAGNLELSILGFSEKAVASIDVTAKALRRLASSIDKINNTQFVLAGEKMEVLFRKLANSTNAINTKNLDNLAIAAKSLSAVSKIGNLETVDYGKVSKGFSTLTVAITPFINKVKEAEVSLSSLYGILSKSSSKKLGNLLNGDFGNTSSNNKGFSFRSFFNIGKWTAIFYAGRRLGSIFANIAQKGADFSETLNLWQVSMGQEFLPQATKFVNKLNEAYGISKETLMNSQAIFKNMLGSLGQISEQSAYALSEGVTQMALDYASLYNVKFEEAMNKFQAALAGQVRPIRSASGYDITENTLFQLYQEIGGEKTMRQLSRTEKQLLSIYAVFQQMERSGARGDLGRTLDSFSNQSRIASENFKEILTYSGLIFTRWVQTTKLFQHFNGFLMFIGDVLEAVANTLPDIEVPNDPLANMAENAELTNKEVDELKGKLLGFDKFRFLNPVENASESMDLDQTLIDAFSKYGSVFDNIDKTSKEFAENLKLASGLFDENGVFQPEKWEKITKAVEALGYALAITFAVKNLDKIIGFVTAIFNLENAFKLLNFAILGGIIYSIMQAIDAFKEGDYWAGILYSAIAVGLVGAFILLNRTIIVSTLKALGQFISTLLVTNTVALGSASLAIVALSSAFIGLGAAIAGAFLLITNWGDMKTWQKIIGIIGVATTAILGLALAFGAFHSAWSLGLAVAGIVAGIGAIVASIATIKKEVQVPAYANGGLPDRGTMFVAGEAGAEMVYNMPSGQSGVANIQQIAQATYSGTIRALNDWWGGSGARGDIPQLKEANPTGLYQAVTGVAKSQGFVWDRA